MRPSLPLLTALIPLAALGVYGGERWADEHLSRVPLKWMDFQCRNLKGEAALVCPRFVVVFQGHKWTSELGGGYRVDERYGGLFPPDSEPLIIRESDEMTYRYEAYGVHGREARFDCFEHTVIYRDYKNEVEVAGRRFSTQKFIVLRVNSNSIQVLPLDKPLPVPTPSSTKSKT